MPFAASCFIFNLALFSPRAGFVSDRGGGGYPAADLVAAGIAGEDYDRKDPSSDSACQRRSHFLRWKFSSYFSFVSAISNHHVSRRKARMVNSDQLFRSVRPYEHHRNANVTASCQDGSWLVLRNRRNSFRNRFGVVPWSPERGELKPIPMAPSNEQSINKTSTGICQAGLAFHAFHSLPCLPCGPWGRAS